MTIKDKIELKINEIKYGTKENPKSINSPLMNYLAKQGNMGTAESKTYFEDNLIHEYAIIDKSDSHCTVVNLTFQDNTDGEPLKIEKTIEYSDVTSPIARQHYLYNNLYSYIKNCPQQLVNEYEIDKIVEGPVPTFNLMHLIPNLEPKKMSSIPNLIEDTIIFDINGDDPTQVSSLVRKSEYDLEYGIDKCQIIDKYSYNNNRKMQSVIGNPMDMAKEMSSQITTTNYASANNDSRSQVATTTISKFRPIKVSNTLDPRYIEVGGKAYIVDTQIINDDKQSDINDNNSPELN